MANDTDNTRADDLFQQEMQGVQPIQQKDKVSISTNQSRKGSLNKANSAARQLAAQHIDQSQQQNTLHTSTVKPVGPHDIVSYKRPGIQDGVFRKLRLGKYDIEARLDLHRRTVEQARNDVLQFIRECMEHDIRCILILPGKGDRNVENPGILKSHLVHWLENIDDVQAFHTAQRHHGGTGAFYTLLKKSDRKKQEARERYSKGRVDQTC